MGKMLGEARALFGKHSVDGSGGKEGAPKKSRRKSAVSTESFGERGRYDDRAAAAWANDEED